VSADPGSAYLVLVADKDDLVVLRYRDVPDLMQYRYATAQSTSEICEGYRDKNTDFSISLRSRLKTADNQRQEGLGSACITLL